MVDWKQPLQTSASASNNGRNGTYLGTRPFCEQPQSVKPKDYANEEVSEMSTSGCFESRFISIRLACHWLVRLPLLCGSTRWPAVASWNSAGFVPNFGKFGSLTILTSDFST